MGGERGEKGQESDIRRKKQRKADETQSFCPACVSVCVCVCMWMMCPSLQPNSHSFTHASVSCHYDSDIFCHLAFPRDLCMSVCVCVCVSVCTFVCLLLSALFLHSSCVIVTLPVKEEREKVMRQIGGK